MSEEGVKRGWCAQVVIGLNLVVVCDGCVIRCGMFVCYAGESDVLWVGFELLVCCVLWCVMS